MLEPRCALNFNVILAIFFIGLSRIPRVHNKIYCLNNSPFVVGLAMMIQLLKLNYISSPKKGKWNGKKKTLS